ncbi:MAG TPA: hypothetical protein PKC79_09365 [Solidesulfovibrio magneticus]|nr:hypothetical protein [Solidesulfovibrio magneticus]
MSLSRLEYQADELAILGSETAILADLLECKATGLLGTPQAETLHYIVGQLRQHRARLETIEGALNEYWKAGRICVLPAKDRTK